MGDASQKAMIMKKVAAVLFTEMPNAGASLAFQSRGHGVSLKATQLTRSCFQVKMCTLYNYIYLYMIMQIYIK